MTAHATPPSLALLACRVLEQEITMLTDGATHLKHIQYYEVGLHDQPDQLRATLQAEIDTLNARDDLDAVIFVYGLCGLGTAGLRAGRLPLIIPRAHDCVTLFMGSKEAYADYQRRCPAAYYYTPGWNRERRVPGPDQEAMLRKEYAEKFDADDVEFLMETKREEWQQHDAVAWLDLGTDDADREREYARHCAEWLGWRFDYLRGDPSLLRDLLWGRWDDARFQIVRPGRRLGHAPNENILREE